MPTHVLVASSVVSDWNSVGMTNMGSWPAFNRVAAYKILIDSRFSSLCRPAEIQGKTFPADLVNA
jgi:hypothetical protein